MGINPTDDHYTQAASELESGKARKGLWARAYAESEGNEGKARALYITLRSYQLANYDETGVRGPAQTSLSNSLESESNEKILLAYPDVSANIAPAGHKRFNVAAHALFTSKRFVLVQTQPRKDLSIAATSVLGGAGALGAMAGIVIDGIVDKLRRLGAAPSRAAELETDELDALIASELAFSIESSDAQFYLYPEKKDFLDAAFGDKGCWVTVEGAFAYGRTRVRAIASFGVDGPVDPVHSRISSTSPGKVAKSDRKHSPLAFDREIVARQARLH